MTALVKGSVTRGLAPPPPPEAHVIKYARGGAIHRIELYGRSFTCYLMPIWGDKMKPSSKSVCDGQTDTQKK